MPRWLAMSVVVALIGCNSQTGPAPSAPSSAPTSGPTSPAPGKGVHVTTPGANVDVQKGAGVHVDTPGANVDVKRER
jgi:hypothetical protein